MYSVINEFSLQIENYMDNESIVLYDFINININLEGSKNNQMTLFVILNVKTFKIVNFYI